jgi:CHAT domain-containing protein
LVLGVAIALVAHQPALLAQGLAQALAAADAPPATTSDLGAMITRWLQSYGALVSFLVAVGGFLLLLYDANKIDAINNIDAIKGGLRPESKASSDRLAAHEALIDKLLYCPTGKEVNTILNEHLELLDEAFVEVVQRYADVLRQQGKKDAARFLDNLAEQVANFIRTSPSDSNVQAAFLMRLLQNVAESNGDPASVYPMLRAHLPMLNSGLATLLDNGFADGQEGLAALMVVLGNLLREFPLGSPRAKLLIAIAAYRSALRFYTESGLPQAWAITTNNLGNAYRQIAPFSANPREQIENAIAAFRNALRVRTVAELPQDYAQTNNNLGIAYSELAPFCANPREQIENAIAAYRNALRVYTEEALPQDYAMTNNNLGIACRALAPLSANPSEQINNAIAAFENALRVYTEVELPQDYAMTNNNLGNAYRDIAQFSENPKQRIEKAIEAYTNALRVRTVDELPQDYAQTNNNLGNAYRDIVPFSENPKQRIEKAIEAYANALRVYTEADLPQDYAMTNNNLGGTYIDLAAFSENPKQWIENAIEAFNNALRVRTEAELPQDYAMTNTNLGAAYSIIAPLSENPKQTIEKAIEAYTNALRVYKEAQMPQAWAITMNNLGSAYRDIAPVSEHPKQQIEQAIEAFINALRVFDPLTRSEGCLQTAQNLGNLGFNNNLRDVAIEGYTLAITAVENLRSTAIDPARKAEIVAKAIAVYANLVQVYVDNEHYDKALEVADRSKARNLVELLATKDLYPKGDIPPEVISRLDALRVSIARAERELNRTDSALGATDHRLNQLAQFKQDLELLIKMEIQPIDDTFSRSQKVQPLAFSELSGLLADECTVLLSWYGTGKKLLAFIVTSSQSQPLCHRYPEDTLKKLTNLFKSHLQQYLGNKPEWQANLPQLLLSLSTLLDIKDLERKIKEVCPNSDQLILIPHRFLHLLPIHALPLNASGACLLDRFAGGVRFAPSLQVLQLVQQRPQTGLDSLFAIQNPTLDLPYTDLEVEAIRPLFGPQSTVLKQHAATKAALERSHSSLASSTCLHFSCHGTFNFDQPQLSALILADSHVDSQPDDADPDRYLPQLDGSALDLTRCLTLLDLFQLDLRQARLVALSACETGLTDFNSLSDEFVGLSSGFLFAGCNSVIGTLWTVSDISTGLLMAEFYRLLKQQEQTQRQTDVAIALKQAQHWLRTLTLEQLENQRSSIPAAMRDNFDHDLQRLKRKYSASDCPFSSPFYWAAFTAVGQ